MTTTSADPSSDTQVAAQTATANNALAVAGQSDLIWGHASVRDPAGRGVWMKASGWGFEEITPERVVLVTPDGQVLVGSERRHIEYPIHAEIMAARPDVGAVVHTHGSNATAFASLGVELRAISHAGVEFALDGLPRFTRTGNLISTRELGRALADTLGDASGCLIPQHGLVTVGPDAATAVMRALLLERACAQQLKAMAAGGPRLWSDDEELRAKQATVWAQGQIQSGYRYLCRQLG